MTHDTRVVDWLGHSGASFKMGRSGGEIHSLSQQRPWFIDRSFIVFRSVSQAVVSTTYDWIFLYNPKANWTYDIITEFSKKL